MFFNAIVNFFLFSNRLLLEYADIIDFWLLTLFPVICE